jgi:hypothetical protein
MSGSGVPSASQMVSKLAAVLLAPLLVAIVWPAPQPPAMANATRSTAALGMAVASRADPGSPASGKSQRQKVTPGSGFAWASTAAKLSSRAGPRMTISSRSQTAAPAITARPLVTSRISSSGPAPKVAVYNNLNQEGMDATSLSFTATPSDSTGAIGPNHYVEMVNHFIQVFPRSTLVTGSVKTTLEDFANFPSYAYCDPQIQWDPSAGRWLYAFIGCQDPASDTQEFDFGWSRTSNPSDLSDNGWCKYFLDLSAGSGPALIFDYPKIGHNSKYMIVGTNVFEVDGSQNPPPLGSGLFWISKPTNGVTTCASGDSLLMGFSPLPLLSANASTGVPAATPVPVNTTTSSGNGYVVSAFDIAAGANKLGVWHLDSVGVLHYHPDIPVTSFTIPAPAPQLGTTFTLDTLDARLTQAVGDPTTGMWTQHTVAGPGGRSMVSWYEIKVSSGVATLFDSGNITSPTDFVFNGAISPRTDTLGAAIIYNRSSASIYPLIAAKIRFKTTVAGSMEPGELILKKSPTFDADLSCGSPVASDPCRWGDYAGISPDPVVKTVVWGTSQWINASTSSPGWSTQNFALSFLTKPEAPTAVSALAGDGYARVSWTPSTYVPTSPVTSFTITAYVGSTATFTLVVAAPATSAHFGGLTNGVAYTFTVFATNTVGDSPESVHSNPVTPARQAAQAPPPTPTPGRQPITQSSPPPPKPNPR